MIRNKDGEYGINKRSKNLQKFKEFYDQEFQIVGYEEGTGNDAGTVIWVCMTQQGDLFKARNPKAQERKEPNTSKREMISSVLPSRCDILK